MVLLALVLLGLALASPAGAITKQRATAIALKRLKPQNEPAAIVFALPRPLGPRQVVVEGTDEGSATRTPIGRKAWLFWEDLAPDALFSHPSRLVLVDNATGRILRDVTMDWWPLVDGRIPAFLTTAAGYDDPRYRVYPRPTSGPAPRAPAAAPGEPRGVNIPADIPNLIPKELLAGDCLIVAGAYDDFRIKEGFDLWEKLAARLGIPSYRVKPEGKHVNSSDLLATVERARDEKCKDVVIYLAGHGFSFPGSKRKGDPVVYDEADPFRDGGTWDGDYSNVPPGVIPTVSTVAREPGADAYTSVVGKANDISSRELRTIFAEFHQLTFKLVVEACFSGRMLNDFKVNRPPNLLVGKFSSGADEPTYGRLGAPSGKTKTHTLIGIRIRASDGKKVRVPIKVTVDGTAKPDHVQIGEFTSSIVNGIVRVGRSENNVEQVKALGGPFLVDLLSVADDAGRGTDLGRANGATHPGTLPKIPCPPPKRQRAPTHGRLPAAFAGPRGPIAFQSRRGGDFDLYLAEPDGSGVQPLVVSRGTNEFNAAWSPSGERLVYQSGPLDGSDFDLYTIALYDTAPTPLLVGPGDVQAAQFCDEDTIVYTQRFDPTSSDVYAIEADGTGRRRLTDGLGIESFPTCSPDGTRVAFISNADGAPSIYEIPLLPPPAAGRPRGLPTPVRLTPGIALDPDYSPDGSLLAYVGVDPQDGSLEVFTIGVTGGVGVQRTFTPQPFQNRLPKFAPDGLEILHTRRVPSAAVGRVPLGDDGPEAEYDEDLAAGDEVVVEDASGGSWGSAPRIAC